MNHTGVDFGNIGEYLNKYYFKIFVYAQTTHIVQCTSTLDLFEGQDVHIRASSVRPFMLIKLTAEYRYPENVCCWT